METNKIICGDTLTTLKDMSNGCVDTIITSPPYWGLRDYGDETKTIWGGDKDCEHKFDIIADTLRKATPGDKPTAKSIIASKRTNAENRPGKPSNFCSLCGAWYGQLGLEPTLDLFIEHLLQITMELKRVLKKTGVMFWNHGDCYNSSPPGNKSGQMEKQLKDGDGVYGRLIKRYGGDESKFKRELKTIPTKCLCLQNYRLILKMIDDQGWILRNNIIWHKPNHMPSSVKDRFANSYEPVFMLVKNKKYWFDLDAVRKPYTEPMNRWGGDKLKAKSKSDWDKGTGQETYRDRDMRPDKAGKNPGDVWKIATQPFSQAHFATFPEKLIQPMILAGCPEQICKKCGKARVRISEKNYISTRPGLNTGTAKSGTNNDPNKSLHQRDISKYRQKIEHQTIGWTDCGCKNLTCVNCNAIMDIKEVKKYAIQKLRREKRISKEILSRKIKGKTYSQISFEDLYDLWHGILREENPKMLQPEMRGSTSVKTRNTSRISKGETRTNLEGGIHRQERLSENICEREVSNGASLVNGETSKEEIKGDRDGSPQEWDKKRQSDRESGNSNKENSLRESPMSFLWRMVQNQIICPKCGSRNLELKSAGFDKGIVLDPFSGAGTTALVAKKLGRQYIGIEIKPEYVKMSEDRLRNIERSLF